MFEQVLSKKNGYLPNYLPRLKIQRLESIFLKYFLSFYVSTEHQFQKKKYLSLTVIIAQKQNKNCNYNDTTFYCNLYTNSLKYVRCTVFFLQIKVNLVLILQNIFFAGKGITIDHCAKFGSSHDVLLLMSELYQVHYLLDFKASFSSRSTTSSHWAHSK